MRHLPAIVLMLVLAAPASAQFALGRPADVFDASGVRVGAYLGFGENLPSVLLEFDGKPFEAEFNAFEFATLGQQVNFESADCSGTPYLQVAEEWMTDEEGRFYRVVHDGRTYRTTGPPQLVTHASRIANDPDGCAASAGTGIRHPAELLGTLSYVFPLHLRPAASLAPAVPLLGLFLGALCFIAIGYWSFKR